MYKNRPLNKRGFTLLEILLVVGIISLLAGIVIIAINPSKQLATVRNTERKSDIKQISNALDQYYIDHNYYPPTVLGSLTEICDTGSEPIDHNVTCGESLIDLSVLVPTYLVAIPTDPQASTTSGAGYKVIKDATSGKIGLSAPAELEQVIVMGSVPAEEVVVADTCETSGDATNPDCWSAIAANTYNWSLAISHCETLEEGGYNWYLPSKGELWAGWLDLSSEGFPSDNYWSSTEYANSPGYNAWFLYTGRDFMDYDNKVYQHSVRCLR